jgi:hypothetical protein
MNPVVVGNRSPMSPAVSSSTSIRERDVALMLTQTPPVPSSMSDYGLAKVGRVINANVDAAASAAGFVQIGSRWVHADGSWLLKHEDGWINVGWKGHSLSALPYSSMTGWL